MILRNDQTVQQLKSEFQATDDASFAHESLVSSYLALPGLRGLWPMSITNQNGTVSDISTLALHLTNVNTALQLAWPQPAMNFQTGNSEVLYRADEAALDIIGNEAYVHADYRGLTIGAWVHLDALGQDVGVIGKWSTIAGNRSYLLHVNSSNKVRMYISGDGTALPYAEYPTAVTTGRWYFLVGRYDPSTEIKLWVNDNTAIEVASIPATIFNGNASLAVGALGTGPATFADYMNGEVSMSFLCAAYLPDNIIRRLYYRTRPLFQTRQDW